MLVSHVVGSHILLTIYTLALPWDRRWVTYRATTTTTATASTTLATASTTLAGQLLSGVTAMTAQMMG